MLSRHQNLLWDFFVLPESEVGKLVPIGSYCVIDGATIGPGAQVVSHVLIPGAVTSTAAVQVETFPRRGMPKSQLRIGARSTMGSILIADIGEGSTVGAGAVVVKLIPPGVVAVDNPARPLHRGMQFEDEKRVGY